MTRKKPTQVEQRRRSKHAEFLYTAGHTLRSYARPELGDELMALAEKIRDGSLPFTPVEGW
jgi:hypothetical protein